MVRLGQCVAAAVMAVGLGVIPSLDAVGTLIPPERTFTPDPANKAAYDKSYAVFRKLYAANKAQFRALNG